MRRVKIKDAVEYAGRETFPSENDKRLGNAFFGKKSLSEDRKDVLDSGSGNFAEHVFAAKPLEIRLHWNRRIPVGQ